MTDKLKRIDCDPACGFMVQSHDEDEAIDIALKHAKEKHGMEETRESVKAMIKEV